MNVLILTPDRVGSTLLQRLTSVYAHINEPADALTINLHELTNGLVRYYNNNYNCEVLGKKENSWGYHQSLESIAQMLNECNHGVVSRLAHYHIKNRRDSIEDQLAFYQYLNDNFYIIAARRQNLFEHAMSWAISVESKKLNVYSAQEKYDVYNKITTRKIDVHNDVIDKYLTAYDEYTRWVDDHFRVNSYFEYERDLPNIENYILNLNVFDRNPRPVNWEDKFDISWQDWNRMHYLLSLVHFDYEFSQEEKKFMSDSIDIYTKCRIYIQDLQDQGVLVSGIPIKLHTLTEKSNLISNINQCLTYYNKWVGHHCPSYAVSYSPQELTRVAMIESKQWTDGNNRARLTHDDIPARLLLNSDLKFD